MTGVNDLSKDVDFSSWLLISVSLGRRVLPLKTKISNPAKARALWTGGTHFPKGSWGVKVSVVTSASTPWLLDPCSLPNGDAALYEAFDSRYILCPGGGSTVLIKYHPQAGVLAVLPGSCSTSLSRSFLVVQYVIWPVDPMIMNPLLCFK